MRSRRQSSVPRVRHFQELARVLNVFAKYAPRTLPRGGWVERERGRMDSRATHSEESRWLRVQRDATADLQIPGNKLTWTVTVQEVLELLRRRWVIPVIRELSSGTKRRFHLHHAIRGVSPKVLTETLRSLERDGVIERVIHDDGNRSKSIAYQLTSLGHSLASPIDALFVWGVGHLDDVHHCRRETDASATTEDAPQGARGIT